MVPADIHERIARVRAAYRACNLCERRCGDDRTAPAGAFSREGYGQGVSSSPARGRKNYCGLGVGARIFNELLHFGEEIELIPSHAVYLTGCNFRCVFCMTGDHIVPEGLEKGIPLEPASFAKLHARRKAEGAVNVNFLGGEPSVNLLAILEALAALPRDTRVVWNSNMYYSEEQAEILEGVVDVYLADWKYGNDGCAKKYSAAPRYLEVVRRNLRRAVQSGARTIVRYLVMPGHNECCLQEIARMMPEDLPGVPLSILDPYVPLFRAPRVPGMDRASTREEAEEARAFAALRKLEVLS